MNIRVIIEKWQYLMSLLIFIAIFGLGVFHAARSGINLTDEGLYFSAPFHISQGVWPFKEAIHNATRLYDLVMAPVFVLFPNITVLQYRILGVVMHLSALMAGCWLFSKFAPPVLVAGVTGAFFLLNNFAGTPTPSYNLLVTSFGTWAYVLWMFGLLTKTREKQYLWGILAGAALVLTTLSNFSAGVIIIIPMVMLAWFTWRGERQFARVTGILIAAAVILLAILGGVLVITGTLPDFWTAVINDANSSNLVQGGVGAKMLRTWEGIRVASINAFLLVYVLGGLGLMILILVAKIKNRAVYVLLSLSILVMGLLLGQIMKFPVLDFVIVVFSVLWLPVVLVNLQKTERVERVVLIIAVLWSLVQVVMFGMFSTNALQATVKGVYLLFLAGVISGYNLEKSRKFFAVGLWGIFTVGLIVNAGGHYLKANYLEAGYKKMTREFSHPKLRGVYSVPEKVMPLEELLSYLKDKVKPGDYLLAYNDLPLLYYLTDTKPIYPSVWSFEAWWPLEYRKKLLEKMLSKKQTAKYAVHMVTNPGYGWGTPVAEGKSFEMKEPGTCILCKYVEDNYVLEKFIFPFQIWRYGSGEKDEFLKDFISYYEEKFSSWEVREKELVHGELVEMTPFWLEAVHGRYEMQIREEMGEKIVKFIFKGVSSVYPSSLDISYFSGRKGFDFELRADDEVALTAEVRLSGRRPTHPYYSAVLFIQDRYDQIDKERDVTHEEMIQGYPPLVIKDSLYWRTSSVAIYDPEWREYAVARKLREGAIQVNFGITWAPEKPGDWMEMRNIHFYTSDKTKRR